MDNFDLEYQKALSQVDTLIERTLDTFPISVECNIDMVEKSDSTLDSWDYCYAIAIGLAGIFISTNEKFAHYLAQIHEVASGASGEYDFLQNALGKLLRHEGDWIDIIDRPFKNRNGTNAYPIFHRLLWGHDILSFGEDNPFNLMFRQKGLSGVLQAVRHLVADATSKQGLPLPGSSFFDIVDENNKTSNYLIKIAQRLSVETVGNKARAQEIYSHIATIRAQEVVAGVVVKVVSEMYKKVRNINDDIRYAEICLIAYAVNFFGEAVIGCTRQKGVPYINMPLATAMVASFGRFCYLNSKELKLLSAITDGISTKTDMLLDEHRIVSAMLPTYDCVDGYIQAIEDAENNIDELASFFRKETE